ncbi:MAG: UDP-N-acetylmuramate dehydrogenase [Anaerolineae bacterium]|nr:MAG: UDP-N-acetylmuramate dehydrogenase [Anaerolineae bacterium]
MERDQLRGAFPDTLQEDAPLAQYTAARIGGPAEFLLTVHSAGELERAAERLWELGCEFRLLGGGSNVLVADKGISGVVVLNQAKEVKFEEQGVWAESGASIGSIARRAVEKGLSGLEWAATIPGSIGGAIVGNAGAHGGDTASSLAHAEVIRRREGRARWDTERLEFSYRTSWLKRNPGEAVVLAGRFVLSPSDPAETRATMEEYINYRRQTQPTGASIGSMFRNPPGAHAGRLIEAAGLKGERRGEAEISPKHANFFVNHGGASACEVYELILLAQQRVAEKSGVELELEIELLGDWEVNA